MLGQIAELEEQVRRDWAEIAPRWRLPSFDGLEVPTHRLMLTPRPMLTHVRQVHHTRGELSREKHSASEELRISEDASAAKIASLERAVTDARTLHEQSAKEAEGLMRSQVSIHE